MAQNVNTVLDTNVLGDATGVLTLAGEARFAFFVFDESGTHNAHRIGLQASPNGTDWVTLPKSISGLGYFTTDDILATHLKASVFQVEGAPSEVHIYLLAI